ncbi:MAG: pyrroline-5-carboxylate reductase [Lachnospiraceae bacterium]|nr:pyrroline-5-carboxylate reductase [Lachnospiraceae bacterium]
MKIGFIGMGNMAQALCAGFLSTGLVQEADVSAYAPHREKLLQNAEKLHFRPAESLTALAEGSDLLFVACKPYQIEDVLKEIGPALADKALVSIAAGWTLAKFKEALGRTGTSFKADCVRVLAVMPNTPAMVKEGVFLLEEEHTLTQEEHDFVVRLLTPLGLVKEVPGKLLAIGSAVTGCLPAFVDLFIEAYADAAVKYGMSRADAYPLISQAVLGSAKLQLTTGEHPGSLKDKVCSPAGTTIRGVQALEQEGLRAACMASVDAVMNKRD